MGKVGKFFQKLRRASIAKYEVLEVLFVNLLAESSSKGAPFVEVTPPSPHSIQQYFNTPRSSILSLPLKESRESRPLSIRNPDLATKLSTSSLSAVRFADEILCDGPLTTESFDLQVTDEEEENEPQVVPGDDREPLIIRPASGRGFRSVHYDFSEDLPLPDRGNSYPDISNEGTKQRESAFTEHLLTESLEADADAKGNLIKIKPLAERLTRPYRPVKSDREKQGRPVPSVLNLPTSTLIVPKQPPNQDLARIAAHFHFISVFIRKLKARRRATAPTPQPQILEASLQPVHTYELPPNASPLTSHPPVLPELAHLRSRSSDSLLISALPLLPDLSISTPSPPSTSLYPTLPLPLPRLRTPETALNKNYFTHLRSRRQRFVRLPWQEYLRRRAEVREMTEWLGKALDDMGEFEVKFS
ncbi:hypothetical protein MMC24_006502 [Lignoscripta atroalba]|nr:hypothetical protein [Lignoscripta atroalba]